MCIKPCNPGFERGAGGSKCQPCKATQYGLEGGTCHACEHGAKCEIEGAEGIGHDIVPKPGWWQDKPFFQSCVSASTVQVLRARKTELTHTENNVTSTRRAKAKQPGLEITSKSSSDSSSGIKGSRTSSPSQRITRASAASGLAADCSNVSAVATSLPVMIDRYQGRANMYMLLITFNWKYIDEFATTFMILQLLMPRRQESMPKYKWHWNLWGGLSWAGLRVRPCTLEPPECLNPYSKKIRRRTQMFVFMGVPMQAVQGWLVAKLACLHKVPRRHT